MSSPPRSARRERIEELNAEIDDLMMRYLCMPPRIQEIIAAKIEEKFQEIEELSRQRPVSPSTAQRFAPGAGVLLLLWGLLSPSFESMVLGALTLVLALIWRDRAGKRDVPEAGKADTRAP